jgi:hypothetical protein
LEDHYRFLLDSPRLKAGALTTCVKSAQSWWKDNDSLLWD